MRVAIRTVLILTFLFASGAPVAVFWHLPRSATLHNKVAEAHERNSILAKTLGSALSAYHSDLVTIFGAFAQKIAIGEIDNLEAVFSNLYFRHVCVVDPSSGVVLGAYFDGANTCPQTVPEEQLRLFSELASGDAVALSDVVTPGGGEPQIYLVKSVSDVLVVGAIQTTFFQNLQKQISFGYQGHAEILDRSGKVIAHPLDESAHSAADLSNISAVQRMLAGESGVAIFHSPVLNGDMVAGFTAVEGPGWGVIVAQPIQELEDAATRINRNAFVLLVTGLMFLTLIVFWVSLRIAERINKVAIATLQVGQSSSDVRLKEDRSFLRVRELNDLEIGFNRMATEIAESRAAEAARTADLEAARAMEAAQRVDFELANQTLRDEIAERELVQAMLKKSEARFRNLFECETVAIREEDFSQVKAEISSVLGAEDDEAFSAFLAKNPQFITECVDKVIVVDANIATVKLYGFQDKYQLLKSITKQIVADNPNVMRKIISAIHRGETRLEFESLVKPADGRDRVVMVRWAVATGYEKNYGRVLITSVDITERRLAEERLKQAQKMEAVGQLTGGVAHDFNNLLAVIAGNAELLADEPGINISLTNSINRAVRRGSELTQRLLAFSRLQPLRPRVIAVGALVSSMSDLLTRTLGETIELETIEAQNMWEALADAGQVENALLNLAINARDAMPNGGKMTIECANVQLEDARFADDSDALTGDFVMLSVSDTGVGMTAEELAHACEPFFTTKEVGKGSGLGLSMVYGFAKQSGGNIRVSSELGKGTTVGLFLPRAVQAKKIKILDRASEEIPRGRGENVLIIEDDEEVRLLAAQVLKNLGYRVVDVPDAASAREFLAKNEHVDIVLSDVILPGDTSGPKFAEEARAARPSLKVVFMSGYSAEAAAREGFLKSDCVLLSKPFGKRQLATALRDQLDASAA